MAEFTPGKTVRSSESSVRVDTLLAPGRYLFRLVVLDNDRNASAPAERIVSVVKDAIESPPITRTSPTTPVMPTAVVAPTEPVAPVAPTGDRARKRHASRRPKAAPARKRRTRRRPKP
jgi:hypothetical protein